MIRVIATTTWFSLACASWLLFESALPAQENARSSAEQLEDSVFRRFTWRTWTTAHGLPQNSVSAIAQSQDGFLWIGTQSGLSRFDGINFRNFDVINTPELGGNRISSLFVSSKGGLWIGTRFHGIVRRRNDRFESFKDWTNAPHGSIEAIVEDADGTIWIASTELTRFDGDEFVPVALPGVEATRIHSLHVETAGPKQRIWVATSSGLYFVEDGQCRQAIAESGPVDTEVHFVGPNSDGRILVAAKEPLAMDQDRFKVIAGENVGRVTTAAMDSAADQWIGSSNGLYLQNNLPEAIELAEIEYFKASPIWPNQQREYFVQDLMQDHEGNLWMGTRQNGLVSIQRRRFEVTGLPLIGRHRWATPSYETTNDIWLAFTDFVARYRDGSWEQFPPISNIETIHRTATGPDGSYWIAHEGALSVLRDAQWTHHQHAFGTAHGICVCRDGTVLFLTRNGLVSFDGSDFSIMAEHANFADVAFPVSFLETEDGLLVASSRHLWRIDSDKTIKQIKVEEPLPKELRSLHQTSDGTLWISSYGEGLLRIKNGRLSRFNTENGFPDNSLGRILADRYGNFWINSNHGVIKVRVAELQAYADRKSNHFFATVLSTGEGNGIAGGYLAGGLLWFPTVTAVAIIDPSEFAQRQTSPYITLEKVIIDGIVHDHHQLLRTRPRDGNIEFQFTSPNMSQPDLVRYEYMLENYDKDWVDAGTRRSAMYTGVPPGKYRFRVKACNAQGVWSETESSITISILPHFYQTGWFASVSAVVLIGMIYLGVRFRLRRIQRHNKELHQSEERMAMVLLGADLGTWDWDIKTGKVTYNEHWAENLGYRLDELEPYLASRQNLIHPDDNPGVQEHWQEHVDFKRDFYQAECRMRHRNGNWIWVQETGKIINGLRTASPFEFAGRRKTLTCTNDSKSNCRNTETN